MIQNNYIYSKLVSLLPQVLPLIKPALNDMYFPSEIKDYPTLSYDKNNGFPSISTYPSKVEVGNAFRKSHRDKPPVDLTDFDDFNELFSYLLDFSKMKSYYAGPGDPESDRAKEMFNYVCAQFIEDFVARYYYLHGEEFIEEQFSKIYMPVEQYLYAEKLHLDLSVPILFAKFERDYLEIAPNIVFRRISDDVQRARYKVIGYSPAIVSSVYMSATHELVLKGFEYDRPQNWFLSPFQNVGIYPVENIENFFTILKIVTGVSSGFAQILVHPIGWADMYNADLVRITGASTRSYPYYFDDFHWNSNSFPIVSAVQLEEIKVLLNKVQNTDQNKLHLSLKRFHKSILRKEEEDIIVDLIISLEMLLGDSEKTEITHKLAMRIAAILKVSNPANYSDAFKIFQNVKKIYNYRSKIVHGGHQVEKHRLITSESKESIPVVNLTERYLRDILRVLISETKYLKAEEIDKLLLSN